MAPEERIGLSIDLFRIDLEAGPGARRRNPARPARPQEGSDSDVMLFGMDHYADCFSLRCGHCFRMIQAENGNGGATSTVPMPRSGEGGSRTMAASGTRSQPATGTGPI